MDSDDQFANGNLLITIYALLDSPTFTRNSVDSSAWRTTFVDLIGRMNQLLTELDKRGQRIDFMQTIGVHGKLQDVTSLVSWMNQRLPDIAADQLSPENRLNRYFGAGWGQFANGFLFDSELDGDLAFFVDDERIYLNHQLRRSADQASLYLLN